MMGNYSKIREVIQRYFERKSSIYPKSLNAEKQPVKRDDENLQQCYYCEGSGYNDAPQIGTGMLDGHNYQNEILGEHFCPICKGSGFI